MRLVRVLTSEGKTRHGILREATVCLITGNLFGKWRETGETVALDQVRLLAPLRPANVLCIGRNYRAHAAEGGVAAPAAPILFVKANSCVTGPEEPIVLPETAPGRVDYEAELVVVLRRRACRVSEKEALDCVLGYSCGNDVSARDCQAADGQWSRAKSFDTFGPLGPWIETQADPSALHIQGRLNGQIMQDARTSEMIFSVPYLISYLSRGMTLLPGTVLFTGTPAGCGFARQPPVWLQPGDVYEVEIEGIGVLRNPVTRAAQSVAQVIKAGSGEAG